MSIGSEDNLRSDFSYTFMGSNQNPRVQYDAVETSANSTSNQQPQEEEDDHTHTTVWQTYLHLVKGYVGPGCLSLPWSFSQLGAVRGTLACIILAYWTSRNCYVIVRLKKKVNHRRHASANLLYTYPDVGKWAYGPKFELFVLTSICVQQLAICTVFFSFVAQNVLALWGEDGDSEGMRVLVTSLALPAMLGLSCLPNLRALAPATVAGTVTLFLAFGILAAIMVQYKTGNGGTHADDTIPSSIMRVPLAMSSILYSYEGINLILPIETAMQHPKYFGKVFWAAMGTVALLFSTVAISCVLVFGRITNGSITAFLLTLHGLHGHQRHLVLLANMFVSVSVVLTFPLQLFPCLNLIGQIVVDWRERREEAREMLAEEDGVDENNGILLASQEKGASLGGVVGWFLSTNVDDEDLGDDDDEDDDEDSVNPTAIPGDSPYLRLGLVLLTYFVAILIPKVSALISLAGALAGSSTALLIPPLIEMESIRRTSRSIVGKVRCWLLFGLGMAFCVIGTGAAIADIVAIYSN